MQAVDLEPGRLVMTSHRVLAVADYRRMPWRNGAGTTSEIAVHPAPAGLDDFAWRVSLATIDRDGPFSAFPGVDRILLLLDGHGMRLTGEGSPVTLQALYEPVRFAGDAPLDCALIDGPVRGFNLMLRRDCARGEIVVVRGTAATIAPVEFAVCYAAAGASECLLPGHPPIHLGRGESLIVEAGASAAAWHLNPVDAGAVALVAMIGAA